MYNKDTSQTFVRARAVCRPVIKGYYFSSIGYKRSDLQISTILYKICKKTVPAKCGNNKLVSPFQEKMQSSATRL